MNRGFNASHVARKSLHERLFNFNHTFGTGALTWIAAMCSICWCVLIWPNASLRRKIVLATSAGVGLAVLFIVVNLWATRSMEAKAAATILRIPNSTVADVSCSIDMQTGSLRA